MANSREKKTRNVFTEKAKNAAPKSASIIMTSNNNLHLLQRKLLETIQ